MNTFFTDKRTVPHWIGKVTAVLGIVLMVWGLYRNELDILFTKAINICLECIGIG